MLFFIDKIAKEESIDEVVIKLYPNTVIRDSKVINYTIDTIENIMKKIY